MGRRLSEHYRERSPIFDGNESIAEVAQLALEQALGIRDKNGDTITSQGRAISEAQAR